MAHRTTEQSLHGVIVNKTFARTSVKCELPGLVMWLEGLDGEMKGERRRVLVRPSSITGKGLLT
eukprot:16950-Amphidinium_carterae.1